MGEKLQQITDKVTKADFIEMDKTIEALRLELQKTNSALTDIDNVFNDSCEMTTEYIQAQEGRYHNLSGDLNILLDRTTPQPPPSKLLRAGRMLWHVIIAAALVVLAVR